MLVKPAQASMGVHFLLSKSLAPTYCGLVKVSLAITALTKNLNTAATKKKEKRRNNMSDSVSSVGPEIKSCQTW